MTGWLPDTNVISELRCPKPEPTVVGSVRGEPLEALYIGVVTLDARGAIPPTRPSLDDPVFDPLIIQEVPRARPVQQRQG